MTPRPRLSDLTPAEAGSSFVMRPGSLRALVLPVGWPEPVGHGPVRVTPEERSEEGAGVRRYRVEALERGSGVIAAGDARWMIEVRGVRLPPEQTRDDTDDGWGESRGGLSRSWWEEQRPPHW
ncbi:MAG: hypothetical protein GXY39_00730 [Actinomycetales bacterium]|nr:hypothetical protein [Tetrasphaera sp.]NLW98206.1 hypothetical protein [Actinomycetales bacterium]